MRVTEFQETKHLDEHQLGPEDVTCRFCNSTKRSQLLQLQTDPVVWLLECFKCHAVSASRMPTREALEAYYRGYYDSDSYCDRTERVTVDKTKEFAKQLYSHIKQFLIKPTINILDFGGGDGSIAVGVSKLLLQANTDHINITLVEHNKDLACVNDKRISLSAQTSLDSLPAETYDLVIASAIIEHLINPRDALIQLQGLLSNKGIFYARTPYVVPFMKLFRFLRIKWDFTFPGHLHDLGPDFWNTICETIPAGDTFRIIRSGPSFVETSLSTHFLRTTAAHLFKAPWHLLGSRYRFVGGWQVFLVKE